MRGIFAILKHTNIKKNPQLYESFKCFRKN